MRTNKGAIQISRSIYDSDIWQKPSDWLKIWIYILGNVNYGDTHQFKRGENYFKYEIIALECDTTYRTVVNCIKFLKDGKQIVTHKTTRGNVLKVINYNKYQDLSNYGKASSNTDSNTDGKASSNTIKEEGKESKESNNNIEQFNTFWNKYPNKKGKAEAQKKFTKLMKEGVEIQTLLTAIDKYKKETDKKFYKHGSTWLNQEIFRDYEKTDKPKREVQEKDNEYNMQWDIIK